MATVRISDLVNMIEARQRIYQAAYQADMDRLTREHGAAAVDEALQLIEQRERRDNDHFDQRVHARAVTRDIERAVAEHRIRDSRPSMTTT